MMELANLKESGVKMSIVLADNPKDNSHEGKMAVIEEALALADKRWNHKASNRHRNPRIRSRHGHCRKNHTHNEREVWSPRRIRQRKRCHNHGLG